MFDMLDQSILLAIARDGLAYFDAGPYVTL